MPQHTVHIGGRTFDIVCQEGQQSYLEAAAAILDQEAQKIDADGQRITENQLLLMSGLLLADRVNVAEQRVKMLEASEGISTSAPPLFDAQNDELKRKISELSDKVNENSADIARLSAELAQADDCIQYMLTQLEARLAG